MGLGFGAGGVGRGGGGSCGIEKGQGKERNTQELVLG